MLINYTCEKTEDNFWYILVCFQDLRFLVNFMVYYFFHKGAAPDYSLISEIAVVSLPHADIFTRG